MTFTNLFRASSRLTIALFAGFMLSLLLTGSAAAATITVTGTGDTVAVDGFCTLREAITAANSNIGSADCNTGDASPTVDVIEFNILPLDGSVKTIIPLTQLPDITGPTLVDGFTQDDAAANTNTIENGSNAVMRIELNGNGANMNGLQVTGSNVTIQGLVINRFASDGIFVLGAANVTIAGNYVGVDPTGTIDRGIGNTGIDVRDTPNALIGGTTPAARNLISGTISNVRAFVLGAASTNAVIEGNLVGTNAAGTAVLGSSGGGVGTYDNIVGARIGGTTPASANVIVGANGANVFLESGSNGSLVYGNKIGTNAAGTAPLGNSTFGVLTVGGPDAINTRIGGIGAGEGNLIQGANSAGVTILAGTGHSVRGNSISGNFRGIDLGNNNISLNDTGGDPDTGSNNLQNFPVIASAATSGGQTQVNGTLDSSFGEGFSIDIYANTACNASGYGEGQTYIGTTAATTNGTGSGTFSFNYAGGAVGTVYTTTATRTSTGDTSEFSLCATSVTPAVTIAESGGSTAVTEGGATDTFTAVLTSQPTGNVTVTLGGTQVTTSPTPSLTFTPGDWNIPQTVTVTAIDDALVEGPHAGSVGFTVASSDAMYNGLTVTAVAVTITDNDTTGLSVGAAQLAEGDTGTSSLTFTVTLSPASAQTVTVQYATSNGTATAQASCAIPGADYEPASGILTFAPTETTKTFAVTLCGDTVNEPDETLQVTLSNPVNGLIGTGNALGTIVNDDAAGTLQFSAATASVGERSGPLTATVQRTGGASSGVTVQYATSNGTALAGLDYTATSGTLTFGTGEMTKSFTVPVLPDDLTEPSETFSITLSTPTGGASLGTASTLTVTIIDETAPCQTTLTADVPVGSTMLPVTTQRGCAVEDHIAINRGGATEERAIITGFGSIIIDRPTGLVHRAGEVVVRIAIDEDLGRAVVPPEDDTDKRVKETEEERQQRQRTNRSNREDYALEGDVVEVRCDAPIPTAYVANRDGKVEVQLLGDAAKACGSIHVGDYLEADGEKQHEQLFEASDVSVRKRR